MTSNCSTSEAAWLPAHDFPALPQDEVHVWLLMTGGRASNEASFEFLSGEERERFHAMKSPVAQQEFAVSRTALRRLLGHYLALSPEEVPLAYSERGKPELEMETNMHFNLSHNRGGTLIALGRAGALGVDIEGLDREVNLQGIARRYYAPAELRRLEQSNWSRRLFFETWTCKEACLKACGHGISIELSDIDTAAAPAGIPIQLETETRTWFVQLLPEIEGFMAALATAESGLQVKTWQWALPDCA